MPVVELEKKDVEKMSMKAIQQRLDEMKAAAAAEAAVAAAAAAPGVFSPVERAQQGVDRYVPISISEWWISAGIL